MANIIDYIPTGSDNPVTTAQLMQITGISNPRILRREIHDLREKGHVICSSTEPPAGYFIPSDKEEAARFIHSMESRRREIGRAIRAAKRYIKAEE